MNVPKNMYPAMMQGGIDITEEFSKGDDVDFFEFEKRIKIEQDERRRHERRCHSLKHENSELNRNVQDMQARIDELRDLLDDEIVEHARTCEVLRNLWDTVSEMTDEV